MPLHAAQIQRYRARISGPLLDGSTPCRGAGTDSRGTAPVRTGKPSQAIRGRVAAARLRQRTRFAGTRTSTNARMTHAQIRQHCAIDSTLGRVLQQAMEELHLSARAYDRILRSRGPAGRHPFA